MRRCTGLRSRLSYFSITGVELRAPGARLLPNLRDSSRQWPMTRAAGEVRQDLSWLQTGRPCGRSSLTGQSAGNQTIYPGWTFDRRQGRAARRIAEAGGAFRPRSSGSCSANASRNPEEMRQGQLHVYDNRENVLKTIDSGRLTARPPSPETLEQIVEDSMSGSHEATMAYPMESILEDISAEVANIKVPTVLLAGELDLVDSIERH